MSSQNVSPDYANEGEHGCSQAVWVGKELFVSGIIAKPPNLGGDAYEQAKAVLVIVAEALKQAGAALRHVVQTVVYVVDVADAPLVGRALAEVFGQVQPPTTLVQVAALTPNTARVEIEAMAIVDDETG